MSDLILPMLQIGISLPKLSSPVFVTFKSSSKQGDIQICLQHATLIVTFKDQCAALFVQRLLFN